MKFSVSSEFLEELRAKSDLVSVASKYLTLTHRGGNYWARCPFHNEKTASFSIKDDGQFYKCFGCGESGNVITFVQKMENVDFLTAVEIHAKNAGMTLPTSEQNDEMRKQKRQRDAALQILKATTEFYQQNLQSNPNSEQAKYLQSRGLTADTISKFKIGVSLNFDALPKYLKKMNFKEEDMYMAGVVGKNEYGYYDFYGGRVIFPIFNGFGEVVAFSGRSIEASPDHTKYKNTPQTPIFNKSEILFGYNFARDLKKQHMLDSLVLVEGHIDVIMCHQAGITNVIGCMGTALTNIHAKKIKQLVDNVILCLDGDNAGASATYKAIDILKASGLNVRVVRLTLAKDPDEYIKKFGKDKFLECLENSVDCVDFILQDSAKKYNLNNNADKTRYINEALNYISKFSTPAEQEVYLSAVQQKVKIPIDALRQSLKQPVKQAPSTQILEESNDAYKDKFIYNAKIMVLAAILHGKWQNFDEISGFFDGDDELSDLYANLVEKVKANKMLSISALFDEFDIASNSPIDKVINYNFPDDAVFAKMLADTIKRIKIYILQQEKDRLIKLTSATFSEAERYNYLLKIKEIDEKIRKEKA